jgi:hypothetical protein
MMLLFVLILHFCGDASPPCRQIEMGRFEHEADCQREARLLRREHRTGVYSCVVRVVD